MPQIEVNSDQQAAIGQMTNDVLASNAMQSMVAGESTMRRGDLNTEANLAHPYLKQIVALHHAYSPRGQAPSQVSHPSQRFDEEALAPGVAAELGLPQVPQVPQGPQLPPPVTTLGPFNTNYIAFPEGIPVGGSASLTLHSDGTYSFNGSFHDSGAPSYNVEFSWVIVGSSGTAYSFTASGHMAGTFQSGSRDCLWTKSEQNNDIAVHWAELVNGYTWRWQAYVNWDVQAAVDSLVSALKTAGTIITTVIAVVAIAA